MNQAYVKPVNEVFARYRLSTCQQNEGESLEDFLERLNSLNSNCNFSDCTSAQIKEAAARDAFISGLQSGYIQQRILEDNILELIDVVDKARRLEEARRKSILQNRHHITESTATAAPCKIPYDKEKIPDLCSAFNKPSCPFCGETVHKRFACPAKHSSCYKCGKEGHFAKVCRTRVRKSRANAAAPITENTTLGSLSKTSNSNGDKVNLYIFVNGSLARCLLDTGATHNHINSSFCRLSKIKFCPEQNKRIDLAVKGASVKTLGVCSVSVELKVVNTRMSNFQ